MSERNQRKPISFFTAGTITVISITLVLILLGLTALVGLTSKGLATIFKENLGITIEISAETSQTAIDKMQKQLEANEYIKSVVYISKEEIKRDLVNKLGIDPEEVLGFDPSLSYFEVFVKSEFVNSEDMVKVKKSLNGGNIIQNVIYSDDVIANANQKLSIIGTVLLGLTIILVFISFTLIKSIIQLNIYSKRFLINTMQLVGATNGFIRRPFVWHMVFNGILAAIIACVAITGIVYYLMNIFPEITSIIMTNELLIVYAIVFVSGILICTLATISAVNRYLKMTTNKLYYV